MINNKKNGFINIEVVMCLMILSIMIVVVVVYIKNSSDFLISSMKKVREKDNYEDLIYEGERRNDTFSSEKFKNSSYEKEVILLDERYKVYKEVIKKDGKEVFYVYKVGVD